jgi:glutathione S-transferase
MLPRNITTSAFRAASRLSSISSNTSASYSTMSSNITLYTWATPNGIKASITLEELGLPYKTEPIDISTNIQKEE